MPSKSVLDGVSELLVHGRPVIVDLAVERGKAAQLKEQNVRQKDKRNLYLLNEGGAYLDVLLAFHFVYRLCSRTCCTEH